VLSDSTEGERVQTRLQGGRLVLTAGMFCAVVADSISSVLVVLLWVWPAVHSIASAFHALPTIFLFAALPAGIFGFFCGSVGGLWLNIRAKHCRSLTRIVIESAALGFFLSLLFPLLHAMLRLGIEGERLEPRAFLFSVAVGCPTAMLLALYCGPGLLAQGTGGW
jgi:hypothetical protein